MKAQGGLRAYLKSLPESKLVYDEDKELEEDYMISYRKAMEMGTQQISGLSERSHLHHKI